MIRDMSKDVGSGVIGFTADSVADIANLPHLHAGSVDVTSIYQEPVPMGSWVLIIDDSTVYMLNSADQWVEI